MRIALWSAIVALILAIVVGVGAQSRPPADRPVDLIRPVPASWYASLPADPDLASEAFLERVPPVMRERGEAVSKSRYAALAARVIVGLGALLLFLITGASAALSSMLVRFSQRQWVRDTVFAAAMLAYA